MSFNIILLSRLRQIFLFDDVDALCWPCKSKMAAINRYAIIGIFSRESS